MLRESDFSVFFGARFVLVGDIDPGNPASLSEEDLAAIASEAGVEVWGARPNMHRVLPLASVVVLPSYREGLPRVLVEAAACGRAVVTTDVPGCRDAIEPGVTGLLVPPRNPGELAQALRRLLNDRARCSAMGTAGRALAETSFDIRGIVERHMSIYSELLGGGGR
jgi:glycosyltransferase involved in cell wall biosynthesis